MSKHSAKVLVCTLFLAFGGASIAGTERRTTDVTTFEQAQGISHYVTMVLPQAVPLFSFVPPAETLAEELMAVPGVVSAPPGPEATEAEEKRAAESFFVTVGCLHSGSFTVEKVKSRMRDGARLDTFELIYSNCVIQFFADSDSTEVNGVVRIRLRTDADGHVTAERVRYGNRTGVDHVTTITHVPSQIVTLVRRANYTVSGLLVSGGPRDRFGRAPGDFSYHIDGRVSAQQTFSLNNELVTTVSTLTADSVFAFGSVGFTPGPDGVPSNVDDLYRVVTTFDKGEFVTTSHDPTRPEGEQDSMSKHGFKKLTIIDAANPTNITFRSIDGRYTRVFPSGLSPNCVSGTYDLKTVKEVVIRRDFRFPTEGELTINGMEVDTVFGVDGRASLLTMTLDGQTAAFSTRNSLVQTCF